MVRDDRAISNGGVLQEETSQRGRWVLHHCIRPICGAFCNAPGHHGYERAVDLISGQTPKGY